MARHFPVGRVAAVVAVAVGAMVVAQRSHAPRWRDVAAGAEFATLDGGSWCRRGSSTVAVLRLDPARVRLRVRHYGDAPGRRPLDIVTWQKAGGALAVFNAGQYYPDLSYMGLLVSDGRTVSSRPHATFRAALVAEPVRGGPRARVLDLEREPLDPRAPGWREVAQSFMLLDSTGTVRVRRSDRVANRTAVAEDREGRLLVVVSEGGYTLHEFARMLRALPLEVRLAMTMDGGNESQLVVRHGRFRYASFGRWGRDGDERESPTAATPLPAVVEVHAR
jgi:uncharacterized protein YigE (DUF2233 family)